MYFTLPKTRIQQPPDNNIGINAKYRNSITQLLLPIAATGRMYDAVARSSIAVDSAFTKTPTAGGMGTLYGGTAYPTQTNIGPVTAPIWGVITFQYRTALSSGSNLITPFQEFDFSGIYVASAGLYIVLAGGSTTLTSLTPSNTIHTLVFRMTRYAGQKVWLNGSLAVDANISNFYYSASKPYTYANGSCPWLMMGSGYVGNLTDEDLRKISNNPWGIFEPDNRRLFAIPSVPSILYRRGDGTPTFQPRIPKPVKQLYRNYFTQPNGYIYTPYLGATVFNDRVGSIAQARTARLYIDPRRGGLAGHDVHSPSVDVIASPFRVCAVNPDTLVWIFVLNHNGNPYEGMIWRSGYREEERLSAGVTGGTPPSGRTAYQAWWNVRSTPYVDTEGHGTFNIPAIPRGVTLNVVMKYSYSANATECWINGLSIPAASYVRSGGPTVAGLYGENFFGRDYQNSPDVYMAALSNQNIPSQLLQEISKNPWGMFEPVKRMSYFSLTIPPTPTAKFRRTLSMLGTGIGKRQLIGV